MKKSRYTLQHLKSDIRTFNVMLSKVQPARQLTVHTAQDGGTVLHVVINHVAHGQMVQNKKLLAHGRPLRCLSAADRYMRDLYVRGEL